MRSLPVSPEQIEMTDEADTAAAERDADRDWAARHLDISPPLEENARSIALWRALADRSFRLTPTQHVAVDLLLQQAEIAPQDTAAACLLAAQEQSLAAEVAAEAEQFFKHSPSFRRARWRQLQTRVAQHPRLTSWVAGWRPGVDFEVARLGEVQQQAFHQVARVWLVEPMRAGSLARMLAQEFSSDPTAAHDLLVSLLADCEFLESAIHRVLRELPVDEETCNQLAEFATELRTMHEQPKWQLSRLRTIEPVGIRDRTFDSEFVIQGDVWVWAISILFGFTLGMSLLMSAFQAARGTISERFVRTFGGAVTPQVEPAFEIHSDMSDQGDMNLLIRVVRYGLSELEDNQERRDVAAAFRNTHLLTSIDGKPYEPGRIYRVVGHEPRQYVDDVWLRKMGLDASSVTIKLQSDNQQSDNQQTDFSQASESTPSGADEPVSALSVVWEPRAGDVADE